MKVLFFIPLLLLVFATKSQTFMAQTDPPIIGKVCPDFTLPILNNSGYEKPVTLHSLKGKVIIMEFWATYCGPCIPSLRRFEKLQAQFGQSVRFLAISDEHKDKIMNFIQKRAFKNIGFVTDSGHKINGLFYHHFIPHTVVIDQEGIVRAFCAPEEVTEEVVAKILNYQPVEFTMKHEYQEASYSQNGNVNSNDFQSIIIHKAENKIFKAELSGYKDGFTTEFIKDSDTEYRFINCPLTLIYQILYNQKSSRVLLECPDPAKYTFDKPNLYCFELKVPAYLNKNIQEVGIQQLQMLFPLKSRIESRRMKVFTIEQSLLTGATSSIDSTGIIQKGLMLKDLVNYLENNPQLVENLPVINDSGLSENTLLDLDWFQNYSDSVENKLRTLGLQGHQQEREISCLILYEPQLMSKNTP